MIIFISYLLLREGFVPVEAVLMQMYQELEINQATCVSLPT